MSAPDIFLSYNREDADVARRFADAFAAEGFEVWWDQALRSGEAYDKVTEAALRGAKAVVVLWSKRSVDSRWVRAEATIAERNGTLVPVRIEACDLPVMFELTQTADLSQWQGATGDKVWLAFLSDVRRMKGNEALPSTAVKAPAPPASGAGIPVIAVLPIACRGDGDDLKFLAEDFTEEITRELAKYTHFKVIAASRMTAWRDKPVDYEAIRKQLDTRYLIEGKLQQSGSNVRLIVQIADTETGSVAWSKRFAGNHDEIVASPEEFCAAIVTELSENIFQIELGRAMKKSGPFSGWEHVMRGIAYNQSADFDSMLRALEENRLAVAAAPNFGMAQAGLAVNLATQLAHVSERHADERRQEIRMHAKRAMQLDGDNPLIMGMLVNAFAALGDTETSLRFARRRVELEPNSHRSHFLLGVAFMHLGRLGEAIAAFEKEDRLPSNDLMQHVALANFGVCHLLEGRPDEAEELLDRSLALRPVYGSALKWKAIAAAYRGDEEEALAIVRRLREVEPTASLDRHEWQWMMMFTGLRDRIAEPVAILRRLWAETEGGG